MKTTLCMLQLLIRSGEGQARSVNLIPGVNRIGRNPGNDHVLEDPSVSGRHCDVVVQTEGVFIRDLNSTNGTFIDGQPIQEASLQAGQTLQIGAIEMVLEEEAVHVAIPVLPFQRQAPNPFLADGLVACVNHPISLGTMQCTQCQNVFCELCVHQIRRVGGVALKLCPSCSGRCQPVRRATVEKKRRPSFMAWLRAITRNRTERSVQATAD